MPTPAELIAQLVRFVGEVLGASSLRFEAGPTLVLLGIVLVFLQLVARPVSRWVTTDAGGLAGLGRSMALAAEAGTDAVVSLGTGGLARATDAHSRLQTLAALPMLGHVARAAARSGVPLRVLTNDALAGVVAAATLDDAHARTATLERVGRSRIVMMGEGRPAAAGLVMTTRARPAAAVAAGSLREEAALHLDGLRGSAGSLTAASADVAQAPMLLLAGGGALVGAEAYQAAADLRADVNERAMVMAANRMIVVAVAVLAVGSALALAGITDPRDLLLGIGRE
ncbi:MAG TPA: DUF6754 domain-containing protein [Candidatus Binatia bacterium]|nr:DUF6754 domain-containing protein [Candidatus Binatia bacterium]